MKRRLVEPTPAWKRCGWLNRCHGAKLINRHWSAYGLWCDELWNALDLLELDYKHPCDGQPASRRTSRSTEVFADPHQVALLGSQITHDWAFIEALASKLMVVGTVAGPDVVDVFFEAKYGPRLVRR